MAEKSKSFKPTSSSAGNNEHSGSDYAGSWHATTETTSKERWKKAKDLIQAQRRKLKLSRGSVVETSVNGVTEESDKESKFFTWKPKFINFSLKPDFSEKELPSSSNLKFPKAVSDWIKNKGKDAKDQEM